jgi:hypothetical protein
LKGRSLNHPFTISSEWSLLNHFDQRWPTDLPSSLSGETGSPNQGKDSDQTQFFSLDLPYTDLPSPTTSLEIPKDFSDYLSLQDDLLDPFFATVSSASSNFSSPVVPLDELQPSDHSSSSTVSSSALEFSFALPELASTEEFGLSKSHGE